MVTATNSVGVAHNPFLSTQSTVKALLAELSITPVVTRKTDTSTMELSATLGHRQYSGDLPSDLYGNGLLSASVRQTERLSLTGSAHVRHEISSDSTEDTAGAVDPRSIRQAVGARASASWIASERLTIAPSLSAERVSYDRSDDLIRHDRLTGGLSMTRRLSEYTSVGIASQVTSIAYRSEPDARLLSTNATIAHRLSDRITIDGSLGLQYSTFSGDGEADEDRESKLSLAANGQVCRRGEFSSLCAVASLGSEPSGRGALERRLTGGINYGRRLGEFSNLSFGMNYQRSAGTGFMNNEPLELLQANAGFDKRITDFLTVDTYFKYRRRAGNGSANSAQAGLSLRWKTGRK